ncbi:MAG: twin-arginine translocation signal domain-containing protein, partial [Terriglobia bacterium]
MKKIRSSEITPERTYFSRREFLVGAGGVAAGVLLGGCTNNAGNESQGPARSPVTGAIQDELGNPLTSLKDITSYNNFYEFTTDQQGVAAGAADFRTKPWTVS